MDQILDAACIILYRPVKSPTSMSFALYSAANLGGNGKLVRSGELNDANVPMLCLVHSTLAGLKEPHARSSRLMRVR